MWPNIPHPKDTLVHLCKPNKVSRHQPPSYVYYTANTANIANTANTANTSEK